MDIPITTRLKTAPKEKTALFLTGQAKDAINPDNPSANVGGGTKSSDIITNESVVSEDPNLTKFKDRCSKYGGVNSEAAAADGCVWSDDAKDPPPVVTNTQITTPGEDSTWEGTLKTTTKGDVFNPWETRGQSRSIKKEQRDIRRAKIKEARSSGTLTGDLRKQFKKEEAAAELKEMKGMADRNSKSRSSGKVGGSEVITGQRNKMQGEQTKEEQIAEFKRQADLKKAGVGKMKASSFKMKGSMFNKNY
jgi:hypothetical protein|tara:strand:+ start:1256 stop:2002 length:747 start_codon:yes stop_codon:yes gene_type:complete